MPICFGIDFFGDYQPPLQDQINGEGAGGEGTGEIGERRERFSFCTNEVRGKKKKKNALICFQIKSFITRI